MIGEITGKMAGEIVGKECGAKVGSIKGKKEDIKAEKNREPDDSDDHVQVLA